MSGKEKIEGLEGAEKVETSKEKKEKKVQTAEDRQTLEAGVEQMKAIGVSENLAKVLSLVPVWKGEEDEKSATKEAVIEAFGSSENLKDYIDGDFKADAEGFVGLAKAMPILNNIKSFYARRASSAGSRKSIQANIDGTIYSINQAYFDSVKDLPSDEKKELILAHKDTKAAPTIEEIL